MIKSLNEIEQELVDNDFKVISKDSVNSLAWHLQNDKNPSEAIYLTADAGLKQLSSLLAKHLDHENEYVRERAVGCLIGRLFCAEYAEKALDMAMNDPESNVRTLSISSLGAVIEKSDKQLQKKIGRFLLGIINGLEAEKYDELDRESAYSSIINALEYPPSEWPEVGSNPIPDPKIIEEFKKKFGV